MVLFATLGSTATASEHDAGHPRIDVGRGIPEGFHDHYFNVPLAARVVVNGESIGSAMVVLGEDDRVRMLHAIGDTSAHAEIWRVLVAALDENTPLGRCVGGRCHASLQQLAFDTRTSTLHVALAATATTAKPAAVAEPAGGQGLLINQRINAVSDGPSIAGSLALDMLGSVGRWTTQISANHNRTQTHHESSVQAAFAERELDGKFLRAGYFQPDTATLYRQPRMLGGRTIPVLGMMAGSSDTLRGGTGTASAYPIYVSTSGAALVEIYRDNTLVHAQPVAGGLQAIDTRALPMGIYAVELRVIQDGTAAGTQTQLVYKPGAWNDTSRRWRYNAYAGYDPAFDRWSTESRKGASAGLALNYLLHPRVVTGLAVATHMGDASASASMDIEAASWLSAYVNLHRGSNGNRGADMQWAIRGGSGSIVVALGTDSYADERRRFGSIAAVRRFAGHGQLTLRTAYTGRGGEAIHDIAIDRRWRLRGAHVFSRLAVFDRAAAGRTRRRDRGVEWRWSLTFDHGRQTVGATARSGPGWSTGVDIEQRTHGPLSLASAYLVNDASGTNAGAAAYVDMANGNGSVFAQTSPDEAVSGGLNLETHHALARNFIASTSARQLRFAQAVMIIDVDSDDDNVRLAAHDALGNRHDLHAGRNAIELPAFRPGTITIDAEGAHVDRRRIDYHVRRGEVVHAAVRVNLTQAVLGQLVDTEGRPLAGAVVVNGAGQTVSGGDGMFSLDVARGKPMLDVSMNGQRRCTIDRAMPARRTPIHMLGALTCISDRGEGATASDRL